MSEDHIIKLCEAVKDLGDLVALSAVIGAAIIGFAVVLASCRS